MENLKENKKKYESPSTKKTQVELEEGVCTGVIASGQPIEQTPKMKIEVEDWASVNNDVTFE